MRGEFSYADEHFADLQLLRYRLKDFKSLSLNQKCLVYCLAKATLYGRDITFDQFGKYNLRIRRLLEVVYLNYEGQREDKNFKSLELYLKRVWFSNGIYHHYGCDKFSPEFTKEFLKEQLEVVLSKMLIRCVTRRWSLSLASCSLLYSILPLCPSGSIRLMVKTLLRHRPAIIMRV